MTDMIEGFSYLLGYLEDQCHSALNEANSRSSTGDLVGSRYHLGRSDSYAHAAQELQNVIRIMESQINTLNGE